MKKIFASIICLFMVSFVFLPTFVKADDFEVNQYEMNGNIFYWPKDLEFPEGAFEFKIYENRLTGPYSHIKPDNAKNYYTYYVSIGFIGKHDFDYYDKYKEKILKVFKKYVDESIYLHDKGGDRTEDLNASPDWPMLEIEEILDARLDKSFSATYIEDNTRSDIPFGSILYYQDRFRNPNDINKFFEYGYDSTYKKGLGRDGELDFRFRIITDEEIEDVNELHKYTDFPLVKINTGENGKPTPIELEDQGKYVKTYDNEVDSKINNETNNETNNEIQDEKKLPDTEGYSVGDIVVVGGITFILLLVGGIPTWVMQNNANNNIVSKNNDKNNKNSNNDNKSKEETKDFSRYGLKKTKDGNWIKELKTKDGELYHTITYDKNGKPVSEFILNAKDGGSVRKEIYTDEKGNIYKVNEFSYDIKQDIKTSSELKINDKNEVTQKKIYDKDGKLIEEHKKVKTEYINGDTYGDLDIITEEYTDIKKYDKNGKVSSKDLENMKRENLGKYDSEWSHELDNDKMREKLKVGRGKKL